MKKIITIVLTVLMLISSLSVSAASFTDVKKGDWFYDTVTEMTEKGLFVGKGNNLFCPNDTMTRAEFITVVVRALYPNADLTLERDQVWWQPIYEVATEKRIITESEYAYSEDVLNAPISRQEMALIIMRVCGQMGELTNATVDKSRIPDYDTIDEKYQYAVRVVFSKGIIAGMDDKGTFKPDVTLTRAQGATVLYRLVNESKRQDSTPFDNASGTSENITAPITIYEGQYRNNRNAKEGDTFVKADGTKIVLKKGPNGILGEGQGVAPDVGLNLGLYTVKSDGGRFSYNPDVYGNMFDSTGHNIQNENYYINRTTGEGYWTHEIHVLAEVYSKPTHSGTQGEVSKDNFWVYDFGEWVYNFSY